MAMSGLGKVNAADSKLMALDSRGLESLKQSAKAGQGSEQFDATIDKVAKQFEGVFLQWALKSMREATPEGGLFTDSTSKSFQGMYDQELVQHISGKGVGLASEIARQLRGMTKTTPASELTPNNANTQPNGTPLALDVKNTVQPSTLTPNSR